MADTPLSESIQLFKEDRLRLATFINGQNDEDYVTIGGVQVPSVRKFLLDKSTQIDTLSTSLITSKEAELDIAVDEFVLMKQAKSAEADAMIAAKSGEVDSMISAKTTEINNLITDKTAELDALIVDGKAVDSDKLDGHESSYFAKSSDISNIDNTSDINKPMSNAVATALEKYLNVNSIQTFSQQEKGKVWASVGIINPDENLIINGCFDVNRRGSSQTTTGYGSADRFSLGASGGTFGQSTVEFSPGDSLGSFSARYFGRTTVSGQSAASDYCVKYHLIENVRSYEGQWITVLGFARVTSGTGSIGLEAFQVFGTGGSPSGNNLGAAKGVINGLTSVFKPFAIPLQIPSIAGKVVGTNNDSYLGLGFWHSAGANNASRASNIGIQTMSADLTGLHIRRGIVPVEAIDSYHPRSVSREIIDCERYYQEVTIGSFTGITYVPNGDTRSPDIRLRRQMRRSPDFVLSPALTIECIAVGHGNSLVNVNIGTPGLSLYGTDTVRITTVSNPGALSGAGGDVVSWGVNYSSRLLCNAEL